MDHDKNSKRIVGVARGLRRRMSLPEVLLWQRLRPSVNGMFDIRRQHPVLDQYVLDFFYPDLQMAFEIDGSHFHDGKEEYDARRQSDIEATGIAFVRLPARWILRNPGEVVDIILRLCSGELVIDDLDESLL